MYDGIAQTESKLLKQAQESGRDAARQAVMQERQKELVSGLQQEHHVQAAAMERQAKAAAQQVRRNSLPIGRCY